jgi:hypothetical protein
MRKKLQVAVVLLVGHKAQRAHMYNVGLRNGRIADYVLALSKAARILSAIDRVWYAKDTGFAVCVRP